ncbi:hypothetical protein JYB62_10030 [Algoriphagus lutimaris]|nr:hypothetical protein [Algoriphagus lutimaris]MBN3520342.1 hypothetical protein [Algoriphagus lutimaris]
MKNYCIAISVVEYAGILRKEAKKNRIQFSIKDIFLSLDKKLPLYTGF